MSYEEITQEELKSIKQNLLDSKDEKKVFKVEYYGFTKRFAKVIHVPTGLCAYCQDSGSRNTNRKRAKQKLIRLIDKQDAQDEG